MQQGNFSATWTQAQYFSAYVDANGNIIGANTMNGQQQIVGVTMEQYKQMEALATEATEKASQYKQQLIDSGILVIPPTPEEQIAKLTEQVAMLTEQVALQNKARTQAEAQNGHITNGESGTTTGQSLALKNRTSTTNGVSIPTNKTGLGTNDGAIRKG